MNQIYTAWPLYSNSQDKWLVWTGSISENIQHSSIQVKNKFHDFHKPVVLMNISKSPPKKHLKFYLYNSNKSLFENILVFCVCKRGSEWVSYCVRKWQLQKCVATGMYACMCSQNQCDAEHRRGWVTFDLQMSKIRHRKTKTRESSTPFHLDCIRKINVCVYFNNKK